MRRLALARPPVFRSVAIVAIAIMFAGAGTLATGRAHPVSAAGANCWAGGYAPWESGYRLLRWTGYGQCSGSPGVPPPSKIDVWSCLNHHIALWWWSGDEYCRHDWSRYPVWFFQVGPLPEYYVSAPNEYRAHTTVTITPPPGYGCTTSCVFQIWYGDLQVN